MGNYLGRGMDDITTANITVDSFDGDGVTNELTISQRNIPSSINNITVYIDGVQQRAVTDFTLSNSTITLTSTPSSGQKIVAVTKGDATLSFISDSTVVAESYADGAITNDKLVSFDASKLTGTFDAIDGSALTGITEVTVVSSDPTITTNPDNVGDIYVNSTTGEMFSCIDKTTDENSWVNVGGGSIHVHNDSFQGEIAGFSAGGHNSSTTLTSIDRFSFLSDDNATTHGDLTASRYQCSGASSKSNNYGYAAGGTPNGGTIDKFRFSSVSSSKDVGDLQQNKRAAAGISSSTDGYTAGGFVPPESNTVEKFSFSSDANSQTAATLTFQRYGPAGTNDTTHGYCSGGYADAVPEQNIIDRFSFASGGAASDVGDLTSVGRYNCAGVSSTTYGYTIGGYRQAAPGGTEDIIDRFQFAASSTATDVGDVAAPKDAMTGHSSTTHGYVSGGSSVVNTIQKFSFASGTQDAGDVGDLTVGKFFTAGAQY